MAVDKGTKLARIRRCTGTRSSPRGCQQRLNSNDWNWPRCMAGGVDVEGFPTLELDDAIMAADQPGCPLGYWDALAPYDDVADQVEREKKFVERVKEMAKDPMLTLLTNEQAIEAMAVYVERGMTVEFAEALLKEAKGIDHDYEVSP